MSTMIATKLTALQVAAEIFNSVASQSTEYKMGGEIQPGEPTLVHTADVGRKLAANGLDEEHWTPFVLAALAEDGVTVTPSGRICTPAATVWS